MATEENTGTILFSKPEGVEIWIDHAFYGQVPSVLKWAACTHLAVIKSRGFADWMHFVKLKKDSEISLQPEVAPKSQIYPGKGWTWAGEVRDCREAKACASIRRVGERTRGICLSSASLQPANAGMGATLSFIF